MEGVRFVDLIILARLRLIGWQSDFYVKVLILDCESGMQAAYLIVDYCINRRDGATELPDTSARNRIAGDQGPKIFSLP